MANSKYDDRFSISEAITTGALTMLMEASIMGGYEHQPTSSDIDDLEEGPNLVKDRWIRNEINGKRVEPFYGISVYVTRKSTPVAGSGEHFGGFRNEGLENRYRVDPENNMHSTKCIGETLRFECPIEAYHKLVGDNCGVYVSPILHCMSEKETSHGISNLPAYEKRTNQLRAENADGRHDPYIMLGNIKEWKDKNMVYRKGAWGLYLKRNPHNYNA